MKCNTGRFIGKSVYMEFKILEPEEDKVTHKKRQVKEVKDINTIDDLMNLADGKTPFVIYPEGKHPKDYTDILFMKPSEEDRK